MSDLIGHKGKSGDSQHTHYEATDSLKSISYARVLDLVSEGEIEGLADGLRSVYLDETPLQNADDSLNFKGVTVDFRPGTLTQDYIPGFPDVENEIAIGVELRSTTPWVRTINNTALSAVRITLSVPALSKADTTNGDILGYKVDYQIELSTDGSAYAIVLSNSFNGKTTSAYERSARIDLPHATSGWSLRITRLTANANTVGISDTTTIISYTEVIDAKLRYPMSAIVGVQVDAQNFQSIPTRAYDLFGRIIQVPSNYDAKTRVYTGVWDGTFKPSWTRNPAWIFRDLVLNDRYGLGNRITASQVDKWSLYQIARYCDKMVPDGMGGTEPRFTCNLYLQTRQAAYAVLQDIASIFRGISYWGGGSIIASADMPMDPVYVYTAANVINGKFSRVGTSKKTRYTVALVSWNDPADFYRAKVEYIEDADGISRYGIQQTQLTAFGCTSQGQAQRVGRWALATSRLETEAISFDVGMDGAIALPGQIVRISDPARMGKRNGGRVRSAVGRVVTLDKAPVINPGDSLTCILPSGVSQTQTVVSVSGDTVTVAGDWTALPVAQSVWSVDSGALIAPTFKVMSVTEKDALTYTITATQHEPGKFAFIENGVAIQPRPETSLDVSKQAAPSSVSIGSRTVSLQDVQKLVLMVSCPATPGAVAYQGSYRVNNGNWVDMPRQAEPTFDVIDVLSGNYTAKLSAVNSIGVVSIETQSPTIAITRDVNPKNAAIILSSTTPAFHVAADGSHSPNAITIGATLIDLDGTVTFTVAGAVLSGVTARSATVAFSDMTAPTALVTASITANGQTITGSIYVNKIQDGATGNDGPAGQRFANAELFQWSTVQPAAPTGATTFTWASLTNSAYTATDGWATVPPANPGGPTIQLYRASRAIAAASTATSSTVSYVGATIASISGVAGAAGIKAAPAAAYRWSNGPAPTAAGSATFTWASASYNTPPSGWSINEPAAPGQGYTLYKAVVNLVDTAGAAQTAIDWTTANVVGIGYMGVNGTGGAGSNGNSSAIAYTIIDGLTLNSTPDTITVGGTGLPAIGAWGSTRAWTTVPGIPTAGQSLHQSNGTYNSTSTVYGLPYMSTFRVGQLSALSSNLGTITAGSININGQASIDVNGAAIFKSVQIQAADGTPILTSGAALNPAYAAAGTKNSDFKDGTLVVGGDNLCYNSSFEFNNGVGSYGWNVYNNAPEPDPAPSIGTGRTGGSAQVITWTGNHTTTKGITGAVCKGGWQPNITYVVSFWAKTTNLSTAVGMFLGWNINPATTTNLLNPPVSTIWQRYAIQITWGSSVEPNGTAYISIGTGTGSGNVWFDDVMVVEGSVLPAYYTSAAEAATLATWAGTTGTGKPADNATVGAPAGTNVGTTPATTVESNAATAYNNSVTNAANLQNKLTKNGTDILSGQISLQSQYAFVVGTVNDGLFMGSLGLVGRKGGITTFVLGNDGGATFAGNLQAASGTLGDLHIPNGGALHGGAYTAAYAWPASGSGFHLSGAGLLLGNANSGNYFEVNQYGDISSRYLTISGSDARFAGTLSASKIVTTDNMGDESITIPRSVARSDSIRGTNFEQNVLDRTITLTSAGTITVICTCGQSTGGSAASWRLTLYIAGTQVAISSGGNAADSVAMSGSLALGPGTYTVNLTQKSNTDSYVTGRNLVIWGAMK